MFRGFGGEQVRQAMTKAARKAERRGVTDSGGMWPVRSEAGGEEDIREQPRFEDQTGLPLIGFMFGGGFPI